MTLTLGARCSDGLGVCYRASLGNGRFDRYWYALGNVGCGSRDGGDCIRVCDGTSVINSRGDVIGNRASVSEGIVVGDGAGVIDGRWDVVGHSAGFVDGAVVGGSFPDIDSGGYVIRDSAIFGDRRRTLGGC